MALCLANSLVTQCDFCLYDQFIRYKWWHKEGYMSSTGKCFDIGAATRQSIDTFQRRQKCLAQQYDIPHGEMDYISHQNLLNKFDVYCSDDEVAGNGALKRLAPVPLFFCRFPQHAVEFSGRSGQITHGDIKAYDACRYYGALIVAAVRGYTKEQLLDRKFYSKHKEWFGGRPLCNEIRAIAEASYQKKGGYKDGIRGKGYIVNEFEAALWAFWSDDGSFEEGALAAVNLGDDTNTTAAIYGQLAGAHYGYKKLPPQWLKHVYAKKFMLNLSEWVAYEGQKWQTSEQLTPTIQHSTYQPESDDKINEMSVQKPSWNIHSLQTQVFVSPSSFPQKDETIRVENNLYHSKPPTIRPMSSTKQTNSSSTSTQIQAQLDPAPTTTELQHVAAANISTFLKSDLTLNPDQCLSWSCEEVCDLIKALGKIYATYVDSFKRNDIDGYRLLNLVDHDDLIEFGVTSSHNRRVILHSIKQLQNRCAAPLTSNIPISTNEFYGEFVGDFVPPLHMTDTLHPNTVSCVLRPLEDKIHSKLYSQILKWLGPLPIETDIEKIELIHNADLYRMFLQRLKLTENRQTEEVFQPHLDAETNPAQRRKVLDRVKILTQQVHHNRSVPVVRVWHGCDRTNVPKLLSNGFAALSKLDNGWFGTAMYFTSSAEYAAKYTSSNGCLIMCYVVLLNPFPVIADDAPLGVSSTKFRFYGKGNYSNYQCHYIPVAPIDEETSWNFRPPPNRVQDAPYDELAVFQQSDILPQVVVYLKPRSNTPAIVNFKDNAPKKFLSKD